MTTLNTDSIPSDVLPGDGLSRLRARVAAGSMSCTTPAAQALASVAPAKSRLRAGDWLRARGLNARADETADGQVRYTLDRCLFDDRHSGPGTAVVQDSNGRLSYYCPHESCADRHTCDVADRIGWPESQHFDLAARVGRYLLVEEWLASQGVATRKRLLAGGEIAYIFTCPFCSDHGEAHIVQDAAGELLDSRCAALGCKCASRFELMEKIGKPAAGHYALFRRLSHDANDRNRAGGPLASIKLTPFGASAHGFMSSAALAAADFLPEWLVKDVLVRGQPAVLGGPQKSLKTGVAIDLALSLGSGTPFLGAFTVARPVRVAMLSGESGQAVIQETARRICAAKKIDLARANVMWGFRLPQLADPRQVAVLRDHLWDNGAEVLVLDPLYLSLLAGQSAEGLSASNLYQIGPLLSSVTRACLDADVTPILVHHTKKTRAEVRHPLGLDDLAFAGIGEFARQWLLLSRREAFVLGSGLHRLWLAVGGSAGHSGEWAVDVDEGSLRDDFSGRGWKVNLADGEARRDAKAERKVRRDIEVDDRLYEALRRQDPDREGIGFTKLRKQLKLSNDAISCSVERLVERGLVENVKVKVKAPNGKRTARGLRWLSESESPGSSGRMTGTVLSPDA